jgi:hypothetical protein
MKMIVLILSTVLFTGCMTPQQMSTYKPIRSSIDPDQMSGQASTGWSRLNSQTVIGSQAPYPTASTIVTTQGNYVVIPNYSSGGVQAIITPGR